MMTGSIKWIHVSALLCLNFGCIPDVLMKYQQPASLPPSRDVVNSSSQNEEQTALDQESNAAGSEVSARNQILKPTAQARAIDPQTFVYSRNLQQVWDGTLKVLLKNYTLSSVDRPAGMIITDWDSYHVNHKVYRNKLTLMIRNYGQGQTEVVIKNSSEYLKVDVGTDISSGSAAPDGVLGKREIWLPLDDQFQETNPIAQNISIILNLPDPGFVKQSALARGVKPEASNDEQVTW